MKVKASDIQKRYAQMSNDDLARMSPATLTEEAREVFHAELERRGHSEQSFTELQENAAKDEQLVKQGIRKKNVNQVKAFFIFILIAILASIAAVAAKNMTGIHPLIASFAVIILLLPFLKRRLK